MLFCKGKIPRLKLCKTCRVPFVPDADVGTDDLTAEGCGAWSCVQGLAAVKRHGQVCADGSLGGLTRIGVDAAGQIDGQHEFGKFSPKTKKRVPLSVPREQRVNALCMEKSVLHGFGQECEK